MIGFSVKDDATPELTRILSGVRHRRPIMARLGKQLEVALREHFLLRESDSPNKQGFPRQHFWSRLRKATSLTGADEHTATVTVADPAFALKLYGGTVRPKQAEALAIAIHRAVYGIRPRSAQIPGLFVWRNPETQKAFLAAQGADGKLTLYYVLVSQAVHPRDPRALPDMALIERQLAARAEELIRERKN